MSTILDFPRKQSFGSVMRLLSEHRCDECDEFYVARRSEIGKELFNMAHKTGVDIEARRSQLIDELRSLPRD